MTKNPILNALAAGGYIVMVALVMNFATKNLPREDTLLAPIAAVSLFTLSAAVMGYVFLSQPLQMIVGGKKKQGVDLFIKTVASFGVITAVIFISIILFTR